MVLLLTSQKENRECPIKIPMRTPSHGDFFVVIRICYSVKTPSCAGASACLKLAAFTMSELNGNSLVIFVSSSSHLSNLYPSYSMTEITIDVMSPVYISLT